MESSNPNEDDSNKDNTNIQLKLAKIKLQQTDKDILLKQTQIQLEEIRNKRIENQIRLREIDASQFKRPQVVQGRRQSRKRSRYLRTEWPTTRRKTDNKGFSSSTNQSTTSINSQSTATSSTSSQFTSTISTRNKSTATTAQSMLSSSEHKQGGIKDNNGKFYWQEMAGNLDKFDIQSLLNRSDCSLNDDYYNDNIEECIKIYLEDITKCIKNHYGNFVLFHEISEKILQIGFDNLMSTLLTKFNNFTSLKYLNTCNKHFLDGDSPDCSFVYKNVSIHDDSIKKVLLNFLVCFGELKVPKKGDIKEKIIGQIGRYLENLNFMQGSTRCYAFLYDFYTITFFYCDKISDKDDLIYYQSERLQLIEFEDEKRSNFDAIKIGEISKEIYFNKQNWKIFIKFLTMKWQFYEYNVLNIRPDDDLLGQDYEITERLGSGATSIVYLLKVQEEKKENKNLLLDYVMKISRKTTYSTNFKHEMKIIKELEKIQTVDSPHVPYIAQKFSRGKICLTI
ncbi:unnamed protein product [Rotaria sp. Silwood1]|nr:unnamed protein product [Rotaria sp. Silwood1]